MQRNMYTHTGRAVHHTFAGMQIASYTDEHTLQNGSHDLLQQLRQCLGSVPRYLALGDLMRGLLHPDVHARATVQQALTHDSFWATG